MEPLTWPVLLMSVLSFVVGLLLARWQRRRRIRKRLLEELGSEAQRRIHAEVLRQFSAGNQPPADSSP